MSDLYRVHTAAAFLSISFLHILRMQVPYLFYWFLYSVVGYVSV